MKIKRILKALLKTQKIFISALLLTVIQLAPNTINAQEVAWVNQNQHASISVVDFNTNTVLQTIPAGLSNDLLGSAVTPDRSKVYFITRNSNDSYMGAIDVASMTEIDLDNDSTNGITRIHLGSMQNHAAYFIEITSDGNFAYASNFRYAGNLYLVDLVTHTKMPDIPVGNRLLDLAITGDDMFVYVVDWSLRTLNVVNTAPPHTVISTIPMNDPYVESVTLNSSGTRAYVGSHNRVSAVEIASNTVVGTNNIPRLNARFVSVVASPDGSRVYAAAWNYGEVIVYDTTVPGVELSEITRINVGSSAQHVAINADGSRVLANVNWPLGSNGVAVIDTSSNTVIGNIPVHGAFNAGTVIFDMFTPPTYACSGFEAPMTGTVRVKKNRALPLKAILLNEDNIALTDGDITAPIIEITYNASGGDSSVDVSDQALPVGLGTEGNQFEFEDNKWQFNLKTKNFTAPGTYTIRMISDESYNINPNCTAGFVIQ